MKVSNVLKVVQIDEDEVPASQNLSITVASHWGADELINIEIAGVKYGVKLEELLVAVVNIKNSIKNK